MEQRRGLPRQVGRLAHLVNRPPIAPQVPLHFANCLAFGANLFANRVANLMCSLARAFACRASSFTLDVTAGALELASLPRLFTSLVPRLPPDFGGIVTSL